ncbi:MAG: type VI secretion system contractile sheath large subunit [Gammaproteobacteria bacterium]|nr:type VI secretion system contractile sheath large subunit [Gammaproteobacteria bacterium]
MGQRVDQQLPGAESDFVPLSQAGEVEATPGDATLGEATQAQLLSRSERFLAASTVGEALEAWLDVDRAIVLKRDKRWILDRLARDVAALDAMLGEQVDEILHHPSFQAIESSWRGVHYLAGQAARFANLRVGREIKIRLLNIPWRGVVQDIERAIEFDQSQLFRKIYSEEFGTPGGEPYGLLLADYEVDEHPATDVAIQGLSHIAAAAFAPIILNASPRLLEMDRFSDLGSLPTGSGVGGLARMFEQPKYLKWREFRDSPDARFVGLALPRVLMRLPYDLDGSRPDQFCYQEEVADRDSRRYLWGGAVYPFGAVVLRAFDESNWLANIQGVERGCETGGLVTGLPSHSFSTDAPELIQKYSTEVLVNDRQERILSELGFIPLCHCRDTEWSAFYSSASVHDPKEYDRPGATANARMSATLQYTLSASRFAHYLKVIGRNKVGSFASAEECERYLQRWLLNYTIDADDATPEMRAAAPLREARVEVRERPGRPGDYHCVMHLRPHFQLDQVVTAVTLVTDIAAGSNGGA